MERSRIPLNYLKAVQRGLSTPLEMTVLRFMWREFSSGAAALRLAWKGQPQHAFLELGFGFRFSHLCWQRNCPLERPITALHSILPFLLLFLLVFFLAFDRERSVLDPYEVLRHRHIDAQCHLRRRRVR